MKKMIFEKKVIQGRSYFALLSQPRFFQAVISAAIGYIVMSFLMTATPIEMHVIQNMSLRCINEFCNSNAYFWYVFTFIVLLAV